MSAILLDTCILIDYSRGHEEANRLIEGLAEPPMISVLTMTEIKAGIRNKREQRLFDRAFDVWQVVAVSAEIARLAGEYLQRYRASHGTDLVDAVIAATARLTSARLVTLNLKHFPMLDGLEAAY